MPACELTRKVSVGNLTIRLWIQASDPTCDECEETADELALCASTIADEDDHPVALAYKLSSLLRGVRAVAVEDSTGDGGVVYA